MKLSRLMLAGILLSLLPVAALGAPSNTIDQIQEAEDQIDTTLSELEQRGQLAEALVEYQATAANLESLEVEAHSPDYAEQQRVLAYAYLRIGNALRQLNRAEEALQAGERELECARESGDDIALARTLMNFGTTLLSAGQVEQGLGYIEQSRPIFEKGASYDHRQGLGWYWILQTELGLAGLGTAEPQELLGFLDTAFGILEPIENWAGLARVHGLRAKIHESQGRSEDAARDRELEAACQARVDQ